MSRTREVTGVCAVAFALLCHYELCRSAIESLFLEHHGAGGLPWVWALLAPVMLAAVTLYSRFVHHVQPSVLFRACSLISAIVLGTCLALVHFGIAGSVYALYLWKDVHIVVLIELIWTLANRLFAVRAATWLYGLFCAAGSLGGLAGGLIIGTLADEFGTESSIWFAVATLCLLATIARLLPAGLSTLPAAKDEKLQSFRSRIALLTGSSYLLWMLALIATVQVVITLIDFEYNEALITSFDVDERTRVGGQVYALINFGSLLCQLAAGLVLRALGVSGTLIMIPAMLEITLAINLFRPSFLLMAIAKVASKVFDYSLFRAAKEILYIPLPNEEKTQGKAIIDILTYRVAKALASLLLLGLGLLHWLGTVPTVVLGLGALWLAINAPILRRYRRLRR